MNRSVLCIIGCLLAAFQCMAGEKNKSKRIYKGIGGVDLYEKITDTASYFVLTFINRFDYSRNLISFRLDTAQLKKLAVNFYELPKLDYADLTSAQITPDLLIMKTRGKATLVDGRRHHTMIRQEIGEVKEFNDFVARYLGEDTGTDRSAQLLLQQPRLRDVYKDLDILWLAEHFTDSSGYFTLAFRNRDRPSDVVQFYLTGNEVKELADAYWELTKPQHINGGTFAISDDLAVTRKRFSYFIGKTKGTNGWTSLTKS